VQEETLRTVTDAAVGGCDSEYVGTRTGRVRAVEELEVDAAIQGDAAGLHPDAGVEGVVAAVVALAVKDGDDARHRRQLRDGALKKKNKRNRVCFRCQTSHPCVQVMKCVYLGTIEVSAFASKIPGLVRMGTRVFFNARL